MLALSLAVTATRRAAELLDDEEGGRLIAALLDLVGDVLPFVFSGAVILFLYCVLPMHRQRPKDVWPGVLVAVLGSRCCGRASSSTSSTSPTSARSTARSAR